MEQACAEADAFLVRKSFAASLLYSLLTFRRTPIIFVNGQLMSHGRVPTLGELHRWLSPPDE